MAGLRVTADVLEQDPSLVAFTRRAVSSSLSLSGSIKVDQGTVVSQRICRDGSQEISFPSVVRSDAVGRGPRTDWQSNSVLSRVQRG